MKSHNASSICEQNALYYYDVLSGSGQDVPAEAMAHIKQCDHCQAEIAQLKIALNSNDEDDTVQKQIDEALATSLELQYAYTGVAVTCNDVKAFLPSMADKTLQTRVPTPITVHLDNCKQCADDLERIRQMNLTHIQLCRLGQLFAEMPAQNRSLCDETQKAIPFIARLDFQGLPEDLLKHVCLCSDCREQLSAQREPDLKRMQKKERPQASSQECVLPRDIFDLAIPYGIDPQNKEYASSCKPIVSHIAACSNCFAKVQELQDSVFEIRERPASGTVTKFQMNNKAKKQGERGSSLYADWPIDVEVTHNAAIFRNLREFACKKLRPLVKPAAAAAVILFAVLFYMNTSVVRATDLAQIYSAIAKIANVHITRFVPPGTEPTQQQWVSRPLHISIYKTPTEMILWDITNGSRRVKDIAAGTVETSSLSSQSIAEIKSNIENSLGLLPFNDLKEMPQGAKWEQVPASNIKPFISGTKVYDLIWTEKGSAGSNNSKKWRVFVDTNTALPQRVEWYESKANDDYILKSYVEVDYLSQPQIQAIIKDAAF